MATVPVQVPDDSLALLEQSRLPGRTQDERVRVALALQLFQQGMISIGKAAELAGESRMAFEVLLAVRSDEAMHERDLEGLATAQRRATER